MRPFPLVLFLFLSVSLSAQEIFRVPDGATSSVSSFENPNGKKGSGGQTNRTAKGNAFERVKAGESKTLLEANGTGMIQRMWFTAVSYTHLTLPTNREV